MNFPALLVLPAVLLGCAASLCAQTAFTWNAGSGSWLDAPNWAPAAFPNSPNADVRVDAAPGTTSVVNFGYTTVSAGVELQIGRLRIDAGDRVEFNDRSNTLAFHDTAFPGAGALQLDGTLALPFSASSLRGPKTISGTGRLVLGGVGQRPSIYDRTVNQAIIEGAAAIGFVNSNRVVFHNQGLVDANLPGQEMDIHGFYDADRSTNTATLRATNGGKLRLGQGGWLNTGGLILADGTNSIAIFTNGGIVEGGVVRASNGGVSEIGSFSGDGFAFRNLMIEGPSTVRGTLQIQETVTNNGIITVLPTARIDAHGGAFNPAFAVTLAGTGQVILDSTNLAFSSIGYRQTVWTIQGQTIRGRGQVGDEDFTPPAITNRGTFQADRSGDVLRLRLFSLDNQFGGVLRAQAGGILRLAVGNSLRNTGGTIEALSGGRIEADFGRIEGGLVRNTGGFIRLSGMTLVNPGGGLRLEGDLTLGASTGQQTAKLVGDIENTGILRIQGGTQLARLLLTENATRNVTLRGGGSIILGDPAQPTGNSQLWDDNDGGGSARTVVNVDNTIRGFGFIGNLNDHQMVLQNSALVTADTAGQTLTLRLASATNANGVLAR